MDKIIKISIGNIAFSLEEEAYKLINSYINSLEAHYRTQSNGSEIIEDIEERIAELFIEKSGKGNIIQSAVVKEVLSILGTPEAIDSENNISTTQNYEKMKKRLYRNLEHKTIGGVCSGLSAYFGLDMALIRIIFVLLFIGFSIFGYKIGGAFYMLLTYTILWIAIPGARTVRQKCEMYGESLEISDIERKFERNTSRQELFQNKKSNLGRLFENIIGIILVIIALTGISILLFCLFGVELFGVLLPFDIIDYVDLGMSGTFWLKTALSLTLFLPFLGMLYGGIAMLFSIRTPKFRPGLIIFIVWLTALFTLTIMSIKATVPYWRNYDYITKEYPLDSKHDTLFLKINSAEPFSQKNLSINATNKKLSMTWLTRHEKEYSIVHLPTIRVYREEGLQKGSIEVRQEISGEISVPTVLTIKDSLITINTEIYNKLKRWNGKETMIWIYVPENVKVIMQEPIEFQFDRLIQRRFF